MCEVSIGVTRAGTSTGSVTKSITDSSTPQTHAHVYVYTSNSHIHTCTNTSMQASAAYIGPAPWQQAPAPTLSAPPARSTTQALLEESQPEHPGELRASLSASHPCVPPAPPQVGSSHAPTSHEGSSTPFSQHPTTGFASALAQLGPRSQRRSSAAWHTLGTMDVAHGVGAPASNSQGL